jgi:hypothetical protein
MTAMTRPLTKRELALAATPLESFPPLQAREKAAVPQFLIAAVYRGVAIGVVFAAFLLLTDSFGIYTLVMKQTAPLTFMLIFTLFCSVKFIALSIAVAVGLIPYSK